MSQVGEGITIEFSQFLKLQINFDAYSGNSFPFFSFLPVGMTASISS